jgi:hypothetical protein
MHNWRTKSKIYIYIIDWLFEFFDVLCWSKTKNNFITYYQYEVYRWNYNQRTIYV